MSDVALGGGPYLIVILFLFVLAVLWFLLPFAVFGIKPKVDEATKKLDAVLAELKVSNNLLAEIAGRVTQTPSRTAPSDSRSSAVQTATSSMAQTTPQKLDSGPRGICPNCDSQIPLNSLECPNPQCRAVFGPNSTWQVKAL